MGQESEQEKSDENTWMTDKYMKRWQTGNANQNKIPLATI